MLSQHIWSSALFEMQHVAATDALKKARQSPGGLRMRIFLWQTSIRIYFIKTYIFENY